jgi:hypothetical protein
MKYLAASLCAIAIALAACTIEVAAGKPEITANVTVQCVLVLLPGGQIKLCDAGVDSGDAGVD